jgi:hypothetical protein
MTEGIWQRQVLELAQLGQWVATRQLHSRGTLADWTDLVLLRPPEALFVELKPDRGILRPEQRERLAQLAAYGMEVYVWRPADLDDVVCRLTGHPRPARVQLESISARYSGQVSERLLEDHLDLVERLSHDVQIETRRAGDLVTHEQLDLVLADADGAEQRGVRVAQRVPHDARPADAGGLVGLGEQQLCGLCFRPRQRVGAGRCEDEALGPPAAAE